MVTLRRLNVKLYVHCLLVRNDEQVQIRGSEMNY